jgi:hypothetical protein
VKTMTKFTTENLTRDDYYRMEEINL